MYFIFFKVSVGCQILIATDLILPNRKLMAKQFLKESLKKLKRKTILYTLLPNLLKLEGL